jgi:hypothetical protein
MLKRAIHATFQIGGERSPESIYGDMGTAVNHILDSEVKLLRPRPQSSGSYRQYRYGADNEDEDYGLGPAAAFVGVSTSFDPAGPTDGPPMVVWVMGGPGSDKTGRMEEISKVYPDWKLVSVSGLVWEFLQREFPDGLEDKNVKVSEAEMSERDITANMVRKVVRKGEMVPQVNIRKM